ncbi:MAG TPA: hypothetical protein VG053_01830 [Solirubrobacteraceae bacterium]|nr:hypothetical protein [Solirubrobacteraceae bacterium]
MLDHGLYEVGTHLDLADAGFGLGVGDAKACAFRVVKAHLSDANVTQLADAYPCTPQDLAYDSAPCVAAAHVGAGTAQVVRDGGLGDPEITRDLLGTPALREQVRDEGRRRSELHWYGGGIKDPILLGCGVEYRRQLVHLKERAAGLGDVNAHPLSPCRMMVDITVLDRVVEDCGEPSGQLAQRRWTERH